MFTGRSGAGWRVLGVALASAVAGTLTVATARAAEPVLRWKFTEGDALHYRMEQSAVTRVKGPNQDLKTTVKQTLDTTWTVASVDRTTGAAEMTQSFDRIRTKIDFPFGAFEYDSKDGKVPEGPFAAGIVPTLKALVGSKFLYKMSPQGEISDVRVPEALVKVLKEAGPAAGGNVGMFSEDGLKSTIADMSLILPREVAKGQTWTRHTKIPSPQLGTMIVDKTYTYVGPDPDHKNADKVTSEVKYGLEPAPNSNIDIKFNTHEGKGTFYFDSKAGRVDSSDVTEKIDMVIKLMNMDINQNSETSTTVKLVDPDGSK